MDVKIPIHAGAMNARRSEGRPAAGSKNVFFFGNRTCPAVPREGPCGGEPSYYLIVIPIFIDRVRTFCSCSFLQSQNVSLPLLGAPASPGCDSAVVPVPVCAPGTGNAGASQCFLSPPGLAAQEGGSIICLLGDTDLKKKSRMGTILTMGQWWTVPNHLKKKYRIILPSVPVL
jgi:hypothetical protein